MNQTLYNVSAATIGETVRGRRVKLNVGQLFVPEGYKPTDGRINLVLHLHGSATIAEQNLIRSGQQAVLVTVVLPGLSKVYSDLFAKLEVFPVILNETIQQLKALQVAENPQFSHITVTSFSAGFGGVRELLKSEAIYQRINCLVMADSIHAGFTGDPQRRVVNADNMSGFLRFAGDAAASKKVMIISHSQLKPENYASTTETADYLLQQLKLTRQPVQETWVEGWQCVSQARQQEFQVYGFTGDTGAEHMKHLHNLWKLMQVANHI